MDTKEEANIKLVMSQTTYSHNDALTKLNLYNNNPILVIKEYMGLLNENANANDKKMNSKIKSVNQEIYKQIRGELDVSMRHYNNKNPIDINHVIQNFQESEKRLHDK
jgi:hypothetical protein